MIVCVYMVTGGQQIRFSIGWTAVGGVAAAHEYNPSPSRGRPSPSSSTSSVSTARRVQRVYCVYYGVSYGVYYGVY